MAHAGMAEFVVVKVAFVAPSASGSIALHNIYCKHHNVRQTSQTTPPTLTLFSVGWPPFCAAPDVHALFSRVGSVTRVVLQNPSASSSSTDVAVMSQGEGRMCYVVFSEPEEVDIALEVLGRAEQLQCVISRVGLGRWCGQYSQARPRLDLLQGSVNALIGRCDEQQASEEQARKKLSAPDEDGWITVARRPAQRHRHLPRQDRKKKRQKELLNFYKFQQRETQREAIAELRQKFEIDKQKVADLKSKRKFKPF